MGSQRKPKSRSKVQRNPIFMKSVNRYRLAQKPMYSSDTQSALQMMRMPHHDRHNKGTRIISQRIRKPNRNGGNHNRNRIIGHHFRQDRGQQIQRPNGKDAGHPFQCGCQGHHNHFNSARMLQRRPMPNMAKIRTKAVHPQMKTPLPCQCSGSETQSPCQQWPASKSARSPARTMQQSNHGANGNGGMSTTIGALFGF